LGFGYCGVGTTGIQLADAGNPEASIAKRSSKYLVPSYPPYPNITEFSYGIFVENPLWTRGVGGRPFNTKEGNKVMLEG
jgi:hypothetical protein